MDVLMDGWMDGFMQLQRSEWHGLWDMALGELGLGLGLSGLHWTGFLVSDFESNRLSESE